MQVFHFPIVFADGMEVFLGAIGILVVVWVVKFILSFITGG